MAKRTDCLSEVTMPRIGELLNERWQIGARHALYHKDGKLISHM